jgi:hypothetical protein
MWARNRVGIDSWAPKKFKNTVSDCQRRHSPYPLFLSLQADTLTRACFNAIPLAQNAVICLGHEFKFRRISDLKRHKIYH